MIGPRAHGGPYPWHMSGAPDNVSESEVAQVADLAALGLIRFDASLRVRTANRAAHQLLERRPGSLPGETLMGTFVDHNLESLVRAAARGRAADRELEMRDRASIVVRAGPASGGGAWVTLENVTELHRLRRIRSEFIDNLSLPRMLHCAILRSPHAHARIVGVDTSAAAQLPGVVAVVTGEDAKRWTQPTPTVPCAGFSSAR